jgi:hypothetical protein
VPDGLTYALASDKGNVSIHQPLGAQRSHDATKDVKMFEDGVLTAAPTDLTTNGANDGDDGRIITFAVAALALATAISIIKGVTLVVDRAPRGGFLIRLTTDAQPISGEASLKDQAGAQVTARLNVGKRVTGPDFVYETEVPAGVSLDPVTAQLNLTLVMPTTYCKEATRDRWDRQFESESQPRRLRRSPS